MFHVSNQDICIFIFVDNSCGNTAPVADSVQSELIEIIENRIFYDGHKVFPKLSLKFPLKFVLHKPSFLILNIYILGVQVSQV